MIFMIQELEELKEENKSKTISGRLLWRSHRTQIKDYPSESFLSAESANRNHLVHGTGKKGNTIVKRHMKNIHLKNSTEKISQS